MAKGKETGKDKVPTKKLNRQLIEQRLEEALADFKEVTGKKKFEQAIRKAGKLISTGLSKKTFEKLRKARETTLPTEAEKLASSHSSINDLP